jgi:Tfp pilus assembly protein PilO
MTVAIAVVLLVVALAWALGFAMGLDANANMLARATIVRADAERDLARARKVREETAAQLAETQRLAAQIHRDVHGQDIGDA